MVQHTIFDLIGLLSVLIGITASWIFILINYKNLRKLEPGKFSNKRSLGTDFTIGVGLQII